MATDEDIADFFEHFGTKGMRWGVRKAYKPSGADMSQKVSAIKNHKSTKAGSSEAKATLAFYGGLAVIYVTSLIAIKIHRNQSDSGKKDAKKTGDKELKRDPSLAKKMSVDQLHKKVVLPINPGYGQSGTKMNCRRATMTYEMRRRGYDVKATKSLYATGQTYREMAKIIDTTKVKPESIWGEKRISDVKTMSKSTPQKKAEFIFDALSTNPNGSRGELAVGWSVGGGHSMAWEVVNKKPVIFDTQNGKQYRTSTELAKFTPIVYTAAQTRLDNKAIDGELIKRWSTDA